ncbi:MAG: hypothetical protein QXG39_06505 [Candidatus Aenigmatarchaeota archaeon]
MKETLTFEKIVECWKKRDFPDGFLDALENYLLIKEQVFGEVRIKEVPRWLSQVMIAIEIGMALDAERFQKYYDYWKALLDREWEVDLEEVVVRWKR